MKTLTLQRLVASFEDTRRYHIASALLESDPGRQSHARNQAHRVSAILDAIHFELSARATRAARSVGEAQRTNRYLQRLLEEFLDQVERDEKWPQACVSASPSNAAPQASIRLTATSRRPCR